jgi:predicted MPP superfamily phosphohydrolase
MLLSGPDAPPAQTAPRLDRVSRGPWLQWRLKPSLLEWNIAHLPVPSLPAALEGLRIVQVTDLHLRQRWHRIYDVLMERLRSEQPDLLLMTGDFVDDKRDHRPALPVLYRMLDAFRGKAGCYAVVGNHDRYGMGRRLRGTHVTVLEDPGRPAYARHGGATIELIGLPGVHRKDLTRDVLDSLPTRGVSPQPADLRIVLSHFPDHLRRTREILRPDLFLAGHTHGGQCCLPGRIPILRHDSLPRRLCSGVHRVGDTWLVVCRGIGTTTIPLRVFCPPEVLEVRLKAEG